MAKRIVSFDNKGGANKAITVFNIGWMLAAKGKRVIIVDADPQSNLTGLVLGTEAFEQFYQEHPKRNIKAALAPAFDAMPKLIPAVECVPVEGRDRLLLLPGHVELAEYEVTLGIAQELSKALQTLQNLPGSISYMLDKTAAVYRADYVLIDLNPSLSPLNQNLLMTGDFFILPTMPEYFSVMALHSIQHVLPKWNAWREKASSLPVLQRASYPFPNIQPKFLGTIVQNYRSRNNKAASRYQYWVDKIDETVSKNLSPALRELGMMLPSDAYENHEMGEGLRLGATPDFNTLIMLSQQHQTPILALKPEQIDRSGQELEATLASLERFSELFNKLADKIIGLTGDEYSPTTI